MPARFTVLAAAAILTIAAGCGGGGTSGLTDNEVLALIDRDAVVDLVRITKTRDAGGAIEIGLASQVPVKIVARYTGENGPASVTCNVEPPVTVLAIPDFKRDSGSRIVLSPR